VHVVADELQRRVDLVGDAGREPPDRLELLGLPELGLDPLAVGDVEGDAPTLRLRSPGTWSDVAENSTGTTRPSRAQRLRSLRSLARFTGPATIASNGGGSPSNRPAAVRPMTSSCRAPSRCRRLSLAVLPRFRSPPTKNSEPGIAR